MVTQAPNAAGPPAARPAQGRARRTGRRPSAGRAGPWSPKAPHPWPPAISVASGLARYQSAKASLSRGLKRREAACLPGPHRGYLAKSKPICPHPVGHRRAHRRLGRADDRGVSRAAAEVPRQLVVMVARPVQMRHGHRDDKPRRAEAALRPVVFHHRLLHRMRHPPGARRCLRPSAPPCRPAGPGTGCRRSARARRPDR